MLENGKKYRVNMLHLENTVSSLGQAEIRTVDFLGVFFSLPSSDCADVE